MLRKDILLYGMALVLAVLVIKEFNLFRPALALAQEGISIQATLGTAFTYQGRLTDGSGPVNAACDFQFSLFDAAGGGSQVGNTQTTPNVTVSGGLFTIPLNGSGEFGPTAFTGEARWLQIAARCPAGSGNFTLFDPRQPLTAAPYALFSRSTGALNGYPVSGAAPASGQVLKWNGSQWSPQPLGVTMVFASGQGSNPQTSLAFLAPTARVTVTGGQKVAVHSAKAMGSVLAMGGRGLTVNICYRLVGGSIVSVIDPGIDGVMVAGGTRVPITLSAVIEGLNGTYDVGLCGFATSNDFAQSWQSNGVGQTTALISN